MEREDAWVITIENDGASGGAGDTPEHIGGGVDLAKAVELVAHDVEEQAVTGRYGFDKFDRPGFIKFEYSDVGVELAGGIDIAEERSRDAAGKIAAGTICKDVQACCFEEFDDDFCGGGFAIGAADNNHAVRQITERASDISRIEGFDDQSRQRRTAPTQSRSEFD